MCWVCILNFKGGNSNGELMDCDMRYEGCRSETFNFEKE